MGLLGDIGSSIASIGSTIGGFLGADWQKEAAMDARQYGNYMSSTSYTRAMSDMKNAGLNPILASKIGGAPMATASMPTFSNPLESGASSAISSMRLHNEVDKTQADVEKIIADKDVSIKKLEEMSASIAKINAETGYTNQKSIESQALVDLKRVEIKLKEALIPGAEVTSEVSTYILKTLTAVEDVITSGKGYNPKELLDKGKEIINNINEKITEPGRFSTAVTKLWNGFMTKILKFKPLPKSSSGGGKSWK
jgi:hypothetical protein